MFKKLAFTQRRFLNMSLDSSKLVINKTTTPKTKLPNDELVFGKSFTDHILEVEWTAQEGWGTPKISPYHNLSLDPSAVVFHYSFELFEGLKAYKDDNGDARLFRINKNMERMSKSANAIDLPAFDKEELAKLIGKYVEVEKDFIPKGNGYSLYLRPTMIGTTPSLGVATPDKALIFVIASPVGPYYKTGFKAVSLQATEDHVRAWPGGSGDKKLGANYAPTIKPQRLAAEKGHQQILWLFGEEGYVTEVGTMNVFFAFQKPNGKKELVTAPLDGTILEGITRDSILELCREKLGDEWEVSERNYTIHDVKKAADEGTLIEAFGSGTAAIVSPVNNIEFRGENIKVPTSEGETGEVTKKVLQWINEIQYGKSQFKNWSTLTKDL
ncbi:branched-chain-amino-acid aminotransferase, cytosolic [[Candida] jaroonii]|uniref:Branched-chain-amino-acid aminotransferase, cytosolic n=1 Tax=[Candida] jaroonii TaxID=467808 RepID=A0ACA9YFJ5_9ASCO|nr:branched-chain-amino-acid aminotransferase, cytosolic [[Candida] jaroonii]